MKRFALAGILALAATFVAQQQASANGGWYWKGNVGLNLNWDAVMGAFCAPVCPGSNVPVSTYGYPPPPYGYAGAAPAQYGYYPQPYPQGYAMQPVNPAPTTPQVPATQQPATPTTTQIGYYYYPYNYNYGYNYGYGYSYQAPSYWYGR